MEKDENRCYICDEIIENDNGFNVCEDCYHTADLESLEEAINS